VAVFQKEARMTSEIDDREDRVVEGTNERYIDEAVPFQYSITSYGADYPVDSIIKRLKNGDIYVPYFQRRFVWPFKKASRFIESLLLGLPVPGIFLSRDEDTQKLIIIDGQQRLQTLLYFYDGIFHNTGQEFALHELESNYEGATYKSLSEEDRRRLDDSIIHATIIRQDVPTNDASSIFHIFERLNTGGVQLQPQEIRNALYHGELNDLIIELNKFAAWRALFGKESSRFRDRELILRFIALYYDEANYKSPMKGFLNKFMGDNRHLHDINKEQIQELFFKTSAAIANGIGSNAFRPRRVLIAAIYDSIMVGIARRLQKGEISDTSQLKENYIGLLETKEFLDASIEHTTDEINVKTRVALATAAFTDVA